MAAQCQVTAVLAWALTFSYLTFHNLRPMQWLNVHVPQIPQTQNTQNRMFIFSRPHYFFFFFRIVFSALLSTSLDFQKGAGSHPRLSSSSSWTTNQLLIVMPDEFQIHPSSSHWHCLRQGPLGLLPGLLHWLLPHPLAILPLSSLSTQYPKCSYWRTM